MAISVTKLAERLKSETEWQRTPTALGDDVYIRMIEHGISRLYIDNNKASVYNKIKYYTDEETGEYMFDADLLQDEIEYIMILAQISFMNRVAKSVNDIVGYTTDAITVTNADKPYQNIDGTLTRLEKERRILYWKMYPRQ